MDKKMVEEKKDVEENLEEKKKPNIFSSIPPLLLFGIGGIIFLIIINLSKTQDISYVWWIIGIGILLYLVSKAYQPKKGPVDPREADLLVERDFKRKMLWGHWPNHSKHKIGPVSDMAHTDARGSYYDVAVEVKPPFSEVEHWVAKVMAIGDERGFVYWKKAISPITGRDTTQERTITKVPNWVLHAQKYPAWGDFLKRGMR
jgi:hypothetical protein